MKTGIVILNYNVEDSVLKLAQQLNKYKCVNHIVIVDNASKIKSRIKFTNNIIINESNKIHFIQSEINGGYAKGNNIGLRYLTNHFFCDICFICNPDISISEKDIEKILYIFAKYPQYGVLTCARKYSNNKKIRQCWALTDYKELILECFSLYRKYKIKKSIYTINTDSEVISIEVAPGAFWGVRTELLKTVGYMDEETFLYFEESCFAKKIEKKSLIGYVPNAIYTIYQEKASTKEIRKNGTGFKYLMQSKDFYAKKYICKNNIQYYIWKIFMKFTLIENEIKLLIKNFR